ncbi:MAG: hypothetical protein J6Z43_04260 [Clostridiales bacterium]|nr:hypothetical protein [Clostridiales bacterium]
MSKLDSFRFGSFRRKKVVVILLIVISLFVFSGAILLFMGVFGYRSELVSVALTDQAENAGYNGIGLNLDYIPNVNLIRNPSFEKESAYYSLTVLDNDGQSVFFDPSEVLMSGINTQRATGAPVRIVSIDGSGNMSLKYEGNVSGFESARLGQVSELELPESVGESEQIVKTCTLQNTVTALTGSGLVLADITSEQLARVYDGGNVSFTDICCNGSVIYAVTGDGIVFTSADGKSFAQISGEEVDERYSVSSCAASTSCLMIITTDEQLCVYDSGDFHEVILPGGQTPSIIGAAGDNIVVVTKDNKMFRSANGFVFTQIDLGDLYNDRNAVSIVCNATESYILNDDGSVTAVYHDEGNLSELFTALADSGTSLQSIAISENGQLIGTTGDRTAVIISKMTGEAVTISSEEMTADRVFSSSNNRLLITGSDGIYTASVLSDFTMDNDIPQDTVSLGDICFIETSNSYTSLSVAEGEEWELAPEQGVWNAYGEGTSIELSPNMYDGAYALRLSGTTGNIHAVSQKLTGSVRDNFIKDKFYRISLYIKADPDSAAPDEVNVWLSGKGFGKQGLTCYRLKGEYNEYSVVFVVNDLMLSDDDISFNIAFEGQGAVLIDQIYVGLDSAAKADIPESFEESIIEASPKAIRFNNLGIGSDGFSEKVFFGINEMSTGASYVTADGEIVQVSDIRSLERSLRLARDAGSDPWFVLGSFTTQETVNNMLAYMCGSVSSDYGTLRIDNGTALPWSRQFEKVYIEVNDADGSFMSDVQKGSFVDYVIGMVAGSEYYADIKDKIIFIDGMDYTGGTMLSSADAHASQMTVYSVPDMTQREMTYVERIAEAYETVRYNSPRVTSGSDKGEFISSIDFEGSFNMAQYLAALMGEDTVFVEMAMVNCKVKFVPSSYGNENIFVKGQEMKMVLDMMTLVKDIASTSRMYANVTDPLSQGSGQSAAAFLGNCTVSQFDGENNSYLVITNTSSNLQQFVMYNGAQRYLRSAVKRYSESGSLLTTKRLTNSYRRYNLQPGETIIVTIER